MVSVVMIAIKHFGKLREIRNKCRDASMTNVPMTCVEFVGIYIILTILQDRKLKI